MKKFITIILLTPLFALSQEFETEEINVTTGAKARQGKYINFEPVLVVESSGTASELYKKCIDWLNETYKQPEEVIKGKIEGEYVKINGSVSNIIQASALGSYSYYNGRYTIEFRFKDNRLRMELTSFQFYISPTQYSVGGWYNRAFSFRTINRKGKVDKDGSENLNRVKSYFENLAISLKNFTLGEGVKKVDDDW